MVGIHSLWKTPPAENKIASGHFFATLQFLFVSVATQNSNTFHKADKNRSEKVEPFPS